MNKTSPSGGSYLPLVLILGFVVLTSGLYWSSLLSRQDAQMQTAHQRSEWRAKQLNEAVTQQLDAKLLSIDVALKHLRSVYLHNPQDFGKAVTDLLASYPPGLLQYVVVFDRHGTLVYTSDPITKDSLGQNFADHEHVHVHAIADSDALFVSEALTGQRNEVPLVQLTRGLWEGKQFRGVIGIPVQARYLSDHLLSLQVDPTDILAVVRPDGSTIARSHKLEEALKTKLPPDRPFLTGKNGASGLFRSTSTYDRVPMLFSWQRLSQWPVITVAAIDENAEMAPLSRALQQERANALLTIGIALVFSLGVALLIMRIQGQNRGLASSEARHRALFDRSKIPMLLVDPVDGALVDINEAAIAFYGYPRKQMQSMHISDLNQLSHAEIMAEMALAQQQKRNHFQFPHRLASGEVRQVEVYSGPLEVDGRALLYSFVHDITDRVLAQQSLANLLTEQRAILNSEINGIVKLKDRQFVWMNRAFAAMLGYRMEELIGQSTRMLYENSAGFEAFLESGYAAMRNGSVYRTEMQFLRRDGRLAWFDVSGELLQPQSNESIWSFVEITERKQIEGQIRHLAFHDALTKLPNRRLLVERMTYTMASSKRSARYAALIFLDLDNFKPLNDMYGHDAGDLLLIEVAQRLRLCVREVDTVARFGGDEFVVLLNELQTDRDTSSREAAAIAEKIRLSLAAPYLLHIAHKGEPDTTVTHHCTASLGVALFTNHDNSVEDILNHADAAMYEAKRHGRNHVHIHTPGNTP